MICNLSNNSMRTDNLNQYYPNPTLIIIPNSIIFRNDSHSYSLHFTVSFHTLDSSSPVQILPLHLYSSVCPLHSHTTEHQLERRGRNKLQ